MGGRAVVAQGFAYPAPGSLARLREQVKRMPTGPAQREMERFVAAVAALDLGEWEELHTRTLDLSPLFVPYVGHAAWGENYRRGEFMAEVKAAEREAGVDPAGELPDHIEPVLRYLDTVSDPLPDLLEVLPGAVEKMASELKKAEPGNPYRHLLAAAGHVVAEVAANSEATRSSGART